MPVGRDALQAWMSTLMSQMGTSVHLVANHVIDFHDADHASGVVYCRDELERPDRGEWAVGTIQYWDDYERVDGEWCFSRRRLHRWYLVDWLHAPVARCRGERLRRPHPRTPTPRRLPDLGRLLGHSAP